MPTAIEYLQLVIPSANQVVQFIQGVDEVLGSHIVHMVGSWKDGAAITVALIEPMPLADILNKLREMPQVAKIQGEIPAKENLLGLLKKAAALPTHNPSPQKTILVTLNGAKKAK